jgi:GT2 family glycosyltransferase
MTNPLISIIILNWNGRRFIENCLNSVRETTYPNIEIIVVDNGSTDGSDKIVENKFTDVRLIRTNNNLGFAAGNNVGIDMSEGDYIILLNYDTYVDPNWISELLNIATDDPLVGIAGCKIYFSDTNIIQHAGARIEEDGRCCHYGYNEEDKGSYDYIRDVDYVTGAAILISRACLQKVGPLDPIYFMYYEEVEWAIKAKKLGFRVVYVPKAIIHHYENAGLGGKTERYHKLNTRNRYRFLIKNYGTSRFVYCFADEIYNRIFKDICYAEKWQIIIKMFLWNMLYLTETLKSRK